MYSVCMRSTSIQDGYRNVLSFKPRTLAESLDVSAGVVLYAGGVCRLTGGLQFLRKLWLLPFCL